MPVFSILIPTWNNLDFVKLCVDSIRKNSTYSHQVILHINDGSDGTRFWAEQQALDFTYSEANVGVCFACNAAYSLAESDYIVYMNDDMYVCPGWDEALYGAILDYGQPDFYFSATRIEPHDARSGFVVSPYNFGTTVLNFHEQALLAALPTLAIADWQGSNYPPSVLHRQLWDLVGGFSIEFSPGMGSDPDLSRKLWAAGVRNFRGIGNSLVYHFVSRSTDRIKHNDGRRTFLKKWGITPRVFYQYYTKLYGRDVRYRGVLPQVPEETSALRREKWIGRLKMLF